MFWYSADLRRSGLCLSPACAEVNGDEARARSQGWAEPVEVRVVLYKEGRTCAKASGKDRNPRHRGPERRPQCLGQWQGKGGTGDAGEAGRACWCRSLKAVLEFGFYPQGSGKPWKFHAVRGGERRVVSWEPHGSLFPLAFLPGCNRMSVLAALSISWPSLGKFSCFLSPLSFFLLL